MVGRDEGQEMSEVEEPKKRLPTQAECRRIFQRRLAESIEAIVDGFVKEAEKGSCPHVKLTNVLLESAIEEQASRRKGPAERQADEWIRAGKPRSTRLRGMGGRYVKGGVLQ